MTQKNFFSFPFIRGLSHSAIFWIKKGGEYVYIHTVGKQCEKTKIKIVEKLEKGGV